MTHNERRTAWWKEGLIGKKGCSVVRAIFIYIPSPHTLATPPCSGLGVGVLYGTTSVAVGHPFDTVKTKMQAQTGFESQNMLKTFSRTVREHGIRGLYRGALPPLFGSGLFRSTQFAG